MYWVTGGAEGTETAKFRDLKRFSKREVMVERISFSHLHFTVYGVWKLMVASSLKKRKERKTFWADLELYMYIFLHLKNRRFSWFTSVENLFSTQHVLYFTGDLNNRPPHHHNVTRTLDWRSNRTIRDQTPSCHQLCCRQDGSQGGAAAGDVGDLGSLPALGNCLRCFPPWPLTWGVDSSLS